MTLMTFVVGLFGAALCRSGRSRISRRGVGLSGLPGLCRRGGRGAEGGFGGLLLRIRVCRRAYSYTTSFLGGLRGSSVGFLRGFSVGLSVGSLPSSESSSASLRVKASSGSSWLSPAAGPAASAVPAASSSCVAAPAAGLPQALPGYPQHGQPPSGWHPFRWCRP